MSRIALIAAAALLAFSCGGGAPEIVSVNYQINLSPLEGWPQAVEKLSVFALAKEPDGSADFDVMYVINDQMELMWSLSGDGLSVREEGGNFWIGSESITMADMSPLPRGRYRVVLSDRAGNSVSGDVPIGAPATGAMTLPAVTIVEGALSVDSPYPRTVLVFKDRTGAIIRVVDAPAKPETVEALTGMSEWKSLVGTVCAYGYDAKTNIGAFSWETSITP